MAQFFPTVEIELKVSDRLSKRMEREHNKIIRDIGILEMKRHLRDVIPRHFKQPARHKYKHAKRTKDYRDRKRAKFRSIIDLVKTGRTRQHMKSGRIQAGGSFFGSKRGAKSPGKIFRLFLRFPFPVSFTKSEGMATVTPKQMALEIATVTQDEAKDKADNMKAAYVRRVRALPKTVRTRKRVRIT